MSAQLLMLEDVSLNHLSSVTIDLCSRVPMQQLTVATGGYWAPDQVLVTLATLPHCSDTLWSLHTGSYANK